MKTTCSIVLINTNNEEDLRLCLESLEKSKTTRKIDIIIANNKSEEDLNVLKKEFSVWPIQVVEVDDNKGYGYASNKGAKQAKGDVIIISNPDILYSSDTIEGLVEALDSDKKLGVISPLLRVLPNKTVQPYSFGKELSPLQLIKRKWKQDDAAILATAKDGLMVTDWVAGAVMAFPKEMWQQLEGFDDNIFLYFEDNDICYRVREQGKKVGMLTGISVIHTGHEGEEGTTTKTVSKKHKRWYDNAQHYYIAKHYGPLWAAVIKGIRTIYRALGR